jgi:phosphoribosylamine-glycine ligase
MKVLLVGKGGREHALAWRLSSSPSVEHIYVVPGNGGTAALRNVSNVQSIAANDYQALVSLSKELGIGLVVAGPDDAVVDGIEGYFRDSE